MRKKREEEQDHVITDREKRGFQEAKKVQPSKARPDLSTGETIVFLELVSKVSSPAIFARKLDMGPADVEHYKRELDVQSHEEARVRLRSMRQANESRREAEMLANNRDARAAEALANQRLDELERERNQRTPAERPKQADIAADDADRQRRFDFEKEDAEIQADSYWRLRLPEGSAAEKETIEQFRKDVQYRGMSFARNKYGTDAKSIRAEASRLGLKIQWDTVKR